MKKNFIFFLILIIFVVWGGYYFTILQKNSTQTPGAQNDTTPAVQQPLSATNSWETYKSQKFGYTVRYPHGAEIYQRDDDNGGRLNIDLEKYLGVPNDAMQERDKAVGSLFSLSTGLIVETANNLKHLSIRDWVYENIHEQKQAPEPQFEKDTMFVGEPAYYFEYTFNGRNELYKHTRYSTYFFHNGSLYQIAGAKLPVDPTEKWKSHPYYKYFEQSVPITEAIIKSFRFTD